MILRELFHMDPNTEAVANDLRYDPTHDSSVVHRTNTRKTRLTLRQLNQLRKSSEAHVIEQENELQFISKMYATPTAS